MLKTRNGILRSNAPDALWTVAASADYFGVSISTYYRGVSKGLYPAPFKTGVHASRVCADKCRAAREAMEAGRAA